MVTNSAPALALSILVASLQCGGCVKPVSSSVATLRVVQLPLEGSGVEQVTILANGDIIVDEGRRLSRIGRTGAHHFISPDATNWQLIPDSNGGIVATSGNDFVARLDSQIVRVDERDKIISRVPLGGDVRWLVVDRRGITWVWMSEGGANGRIYAIDEGSGIMRRVEETNENPDGLFLGADGYAYTRSSGNVLRLTLDVTLRTTLLSGSLETKCPGNNAGNSYTAVHGYGPDGSRWGSSPTTVMHEHVDGRIVCFRFSDPIRSFSAWPRSIAFRISNDGSAWVSWGSSLIRITPDDRVIAISLPYGAPASYALGDRNDLWYSVKDALIHAVLRDDTLRTRMPGRLLRVSRST